MADTQKSPTSPQVGEAQFQSQTNYTAMIAARTLSSAMRQYPAFCTASNHQLVADLVAVGLWGGGHG